MPLFQFPAQEQIADVVKELNTQLSLARQVVDGLERQIGAMQVLCTHGETKSGKTCTICGRYIPSPSDDIEYD